MTRRRRFDIDLPEDAPEEEAAAPSPAPARRGPMATAVGETARSLRDRHAVEDSVRAENDALAHELVRLRGLGLVVSEVPLDAVDTARLVRDRGPGEDADLGELKASICDIGLSNPIQVEQAGAGRFELVQGFRRLRAFRELHAEGQGADTIPAVVMATGETLERSYRRMVDENLVRSDISFAEMGALATAYAADPATECASADDAVAVLFKSAGYQKRTYIRGFARLMDLIGDALSHPRAVSRNLGLAVLKRLETEPGARDGLVAALRAAADAGAEQGALTTFADGATRPAKPTPRPGRAKTTFRIEAAGRDVRCIAGTERLELSGDTDFSAFERERLERAVTAFFAALDEG